MRLIRLLFKLLTLLSFLLCAGVLYMWLSGENSPDYGAFLAREGGRFVLIENDFGTIVYRTVTPWPGKSQHNWFSIQKQSVTHYAPIFKTCGPVQEQRWWHGVRGEMDPMTVWLRPDGLTASIRDVAAAKAGQTIATPIAAPVYCLTIPDRIAAAALGILPALWILWKILGPKPPRRRPAAADLRCPKCRFQVETGTQECPSCGTRITNV